MNWDIDGDHLSAYCNECVQRFPGLPVEQMTLCIQLTSIAIRSEGDDRVGLPQSIVEEFDFFTLPQARQLVQKAVMLEAAIGNVDSAADLQNAEERLKKLAFTSVDHIIGGFFLYQLKHRDI